MACGPVQPLRRPLEPELRRGRRHGSPRGGSQRDADRVQTRLARVAAFRGHLGDTPLRAGQVPDEMAVEARRLDGRQPPASAAERSLGMASSM
jgi:hypothetical protein